MNIGRLAGLVIFVLLLGIASHSLNFAFANGNTSHEPIKMADFSDPTKINVKLPKDKSIEAKVKEAKEKLEAEIKQKREMEKSKPKGYSENTDVANTVKTKVTVKASEDKPKTDVKAR